MSSGTVLSIVLLAAAIIGLIISRRKIKKESPKKNAELYETMRSMGVKASRISEEEFMSRSGERAKRGRGEQELLSVQGRQFDFIQLTGEAHQYGVTYYLEFLVKRTPLQPGQKAANTSLKIKKGSPFSSEAESFYWKGDPVMEQRLNDDHRLHDMLLRADRKYLKGGITVYPQPGQPYARIRMGNELPEPELLKIADSIAGHIKRSY